jgi:hypothetical protein
MIIFKKTAPPTGAEIDEPFACPEFFVSHIGKTEIVEGTNCMRFYMGTMRNHHFHLEFTVVAPIDIVPSLSKQATQAAVDHHNEVTFERFFTDDDLPN